MKSPPLMLDLFSGLGGASAAMRARGWRVITVDIDPALSPVVVADIRTWSWDGDRPDLIWASPPCEEFSREAMPWTRRGEVPDFSLVLAARRIIQECSPHFWIIENVKGAIRWFRPVLGRPRAVYGPFVLWGFFPPLGRVDTRRWRKKESLPGTNPLRRAMIPWELSEAVAAAVERQLPLI